MRSLLLVQCGVTLAWCAASVAPLPSFTSKSAAWPSSAPPMSINRALKGDRLPSLGRIGSPGVRSPLRWDQKIPMGCDAAFSPVSAPLLANVYGRCAV